MDLRLKLEDSLQEVDARLVLIGEGAFLMALPPLRDEDLPVLPERQQAQCLVPFAVEAIERWVHPSGLDNLSDLTDCHGFHYPTVPAYWGTGALPTGSSGLVAVAEVYDAVAKAALVQQLELGVDPGGKGTLATTN